MFFNPQQAHDKTGLDYVMLWYWAAIAASVSPISRLSVALLYPEYIKRTANKKQSNWDLNNVINGAVIIHLVKPKNTLFCRLYCFRCAMFVFSSNHTDHHHHHAVNDQSNNTGIYIFQWLRESREYISNRCVTNSNICYCGQSANDTGTCSVFRNKIILH